MSVTTLANIFLTGPCSFSTVPVPTGRPCVGFWSELLKNSKFSRRLVSYIKTA